MHELIQNNSIGENIRFVVVLLAAEHLGGHVQVAAGLAREIKLLCVIKGLRKQKFVARIRKAGLMRGPHSKHEQIPHTKPTCPI